ncbi:MAG: cohesin domain-containing protein [Patescibacteria group bacterium]
MRKSGILITLALSLLWAPSVLAAANIWPAGPKQVNVGQTFNVTITVSGAKDVDTIRANGNYSQDLLELKSSRPAGVFQNVSPGTFTDAVKGIFSFGAFTLSSKANGNSSLAVLTFRAKKAGDAFVQLGTSSHILSAGEEQIGSVGRLNIKIAEAAEVQPEQPRPIPPVIPAGKAVISLTSTSHPDPNAWYPNDIVLTGWKIEGKEVNKVFVGFDQDPQGPAEQIPVDGLAKFTAAHDGVWYVHLGVEFKDKTFQRTDLRVQVDKSKPHALSPVVDQTGVTPQIPNFLRFGTLDDVSGIAKYDIYIDGNLVTSTQLNAWKLENLQPGMHQAIVKAFDQAGNNVEGGASFSLISAEKPAVTPSAAGPSLWDQLKVLFFTLFAVLLIIFLLLWDRRRRKEEKKGRFHFKRK